MVIDSSPLISILLGEHDAEAFARAIVGDKRRFFSSVSFLEVSIVIEAKKGELGIREFDLLVHKCQIEIVSFSAEQAELARKAWRRFGKGRHPARLNLGDCCSYALAKYSGEPLLFKGEDFSKTDIPTVQISYEDGVQNP